MCNEGDWFYSDPDLYDGLDAPKPTSVFGTLTYVWEWCPTSMSPPMAAREYLALSLSLRWVNIVPRLTQRLMTIGPIMTSIRCMMADVFVWILLLGWLIVAFASFFRALHAEPYGHAVPGMLPAGCIDVDKEFENFYNVIIALVETSLTGDGRFGCFMAASTGPFSGFMMYAFVVFSCIILTNMVCIPVGLEDAGSRMRARRCYAG